MEHLFPYPKMGSSFLEILHDPLTRKLLGFDAKHAEPVPFIDGVNSRLSFFLQDATKHLSFLKIGYTALEAFLQANCTGPPLNFNVEEVIFPEIYRDDNLPNLKSELIKSLSVDGHAIYSYAPAIELFWLAKTIMSNSDTAEEGFNGRRARVRVNFWHQKLLSESSDHLRTAIYTDTDVLEHQLSSRLAFGGASAEEHFVEFLIERAVIRIYYGEDVKAQEDLTHAALTRHFQFALTGALGKRTKFQSTNISQLVVLAKSRDHEPEPYSSRKGSRAEGADSRKSSQVGSPQPMSPVIADMVSKHSMILPSQPFTLSMPKFHEHEHKTSPLAHKEQPQTIPLNDDTILEHIAFKEISHKKPELTTISDSSNISPILAQLDPSDQPLLFPMDSIILLTTALSITNTSPADGLTREETLPYAERVLEGGSSNWQVYTQALLVRSRIEGYKSRTAERGLLQLQALVDQVIAETDPEGSRTLTEENVSDGLESKANTFLPKQKSSETASVAERLQYIYQLSPPFRWDLESELATRWTSLGGFKSALEIYERLHMHAEVALCLAATDQESEAIQLIKGLLFEEADSRDVSESIPGRDEDEQGKDQTTTLKFRTPLPVDAPRLLCILGDITTLPNYYKLAWTTSKSRYARAQRSLGRHFLKNRDLEAAADSFNLALSIARLDSATWFSLGCVQLELKDWKSAVESFTRCVQLEDQDAQAWSNLAIALMQLPVPAVQNSDIETTSNINEDEEVNNGPVPDQYIHTREALSALRRAATLSRDDARIWDNYLTVAARIPPNAGTPWNDIVQALDRVIELRSAREGESAIDLNILKVLTNHVTNDFEYPTESTGEENDLEIEEEGSKEEDVPVANLGHDKAKPTKRLPYLARSLLQLIDTKITPLVTSNSELYTLLAEISLWRHRPHESLLYYEKSWRAIMNNPSILDTQSGWDSIVLSTETLVNKYKELGPLEKERTGGKVENNWKFKCRNCLRSVFSKVRDTQWEGSVGWNRLEKLKEDIE